MKGISYKSILALTFLIMLDFSTATQANPQEYSIRDLGTLGGFPPFSYSEAIDESGRVFGYSRVSGGPLQAFVWDSIHGMQPYGANPRDIRRINDSGQEVGTSVNSEDYLQAQIDGVWLMMPSGYQSSVGEGINNLDHAVGHASTIDDPHPHHAFIWYSINEFQELGTLGGDQRRAYGINDFSVVVGESSIPGLSYSHGFIWDSINGMQNLNDLVLPGHGFEFVGAAYDINNSGQIAAQGRINGTWRAMLLTPTTIPEPDISVFPLSHDFDNVGVGGSSTLLDITISNDGASTLNVSNISLSDNMNYSFTGGTTTAIEPSASHVVTVTFSPQSVGFFDAILTVMSDDPDEQYVDVELTGASLLLPDLSGACKEFHLYDYGERIVVKVDVQNTGQQKTDSFSVAFYLSNDGVTLGDLLDVLEVVDEDTVMGGLKAGQSKTVSFRHRAEASLSGQYIIADIDWTNQVLEIDETNNWVYVRVP